MSWVQFLNNGFIRRLELSFAIESRHRFRCKTSERKIHTTFESRPKPPRSRSRSIPCITFVCQPATWHGLGIFICVGETGTALKLSPATGSRRAPALTRLLGGD